MKTPSVEDIIASFPHPILPTVQGEPDYHTIHAIRKLLQANSRSIDSHLGGGALSHLGLIVSVAAYAIVAPAHPWIDPEPPGRAPTEIDGGTAAQLSAERHRWEEAVSTFRTRSTVEQALKKQIITVFEPMYLEILNNDMVGFANTSAREMLEHLFLSYGSIAAVDLERNFENMRKAWDPQQPVETMFKQIQDCVDYAEAGGITIGEAQKLSTAYTKVFATGIFHSACRRWNEQDAESKTWSNFKIHFATAYRQHKQMQGESAATSGYANAAVAQPDEDLAEAAIDAFANLASATAVDRAIVATLTEANSRLAKQLIESSQALKEVKALLKKERGDRISRRPFAPSADNYCWSHGYKLARNHTSMNCLYPKPGHKKEATKNNNMGGSQALKE
jgi:O-acetyl-ADP-ribose deacetylase (regulator of RNase III)